MISHKKLIYINDFTEPQKINSSCTRNLKVSRTRLDGDDNGNDNTKTLTHPFLLWLLIHFKGSYTTALLLSLYWLHSSTTCTTHHCCPFPAPFLPIPMVSPCSSIRLIRWNNSISIKNEWVLYFIQTQSSTTSNRSMIVSCIDCSICIVLLSPLCDRHDS
jgi:hypothetical protein